MKKGSSDTAAVILGDEEKAGEIIARLSSEYGISDFNMKTVYAGETKIEKILEEIDFLPLFSERRLLHIKNVEKLNKADCEKLEPVFENPPGNICVILTGKDVKLPLKNYAGKVTEEPKKGLFPQVFRLRRKEDRKKIVALFMEQLRLNEKDFTPVLTAAEIYLKNVLLSQKKADNETVKKFKSLHQLDFNLKTGRCHAGPEFEIFLYYLFS